MKPEWLDKSTIIRGIAGSQAHGLSLEGNTDRDELGVCLEPIDEALRLGMPFEQYVYRDAETRTGQHDAPSQPGELDLTVYGLRQFCKLAAKGNPTVLILLYMPDASKCSLGSQLQEMAPLFVSKDAGKAFLGYMEAQRQRLKGERGQKRVNRPELVEQHGFDAKYAMHVLRLGIQGVELLTTGKLSLPMQQSDREYLVGIRQGKYDLQTVLTKAGELEHEIKDLLNTAPVPERADTVAISKWMQEVYLNWWKAHQTHLEAVEPHWLKPYKPEVKLTPVVPKFLENTYSMNTVRGMQGAKE